MVRREMEQERCMGRNEKYRNGKKKKGNRRGGENEEVSEW
jgi:hypothetical protein